ncbi:hypothetical protein [Qipengyuania sediminis]|uniref:hypothetical protein n=1 Tax=Qipengyuania sediminis TaxID=1532023 RepID=UPI0010597B00|nr:hypothetical protein [Qipengyuania sediminis]
MTEPDFSGVEPTRLVEARRRIAVIERYLDLTRPTGSDTVAAAESLGMTRWQFTRLVSAWRNHRDPTMMVRSRTGQSSRDYGVNGQAKRIAGEEIRRVGMRAEISNVAPAVEAACGKLGIRAPSRPTIYNHILCERREGRLRFDGSPCIVIGRIWFQLPMEEDGATLPHALVAVALPERAILAYHIATSRLAPASVSTVLDRLLNRATRLGPGRELILDREDRAAGAAVLSRHKMDCVTPSRQSPQRLLAQALGDAVGALRPVYRPGGALAKPRYVMGSHDRALTEQMARAAIVDAIAGSNDTRAEVGRFSILTSQKKKGRN